MIGTTVIYHPNNGDDVSAFGVVGPVSELPAMVTGGTREALDLSIFTKNPLHPIVQVVGVPHREKAIDKQAYYTLITGL